MFEFSEIELTVHVTLRITASGSVRVYNVGLRGSCDKFVLRALSRLGTSMKFCLGSFYMDSNCQIYDVYMQK